MFIGVYGVSVLFSYLGMVLNFISIYLMLTGNIKLSILCFMGAAFIDMVDGRVAKKCKRNEFEKRFGEQIDTVLDVFNFGAVPIILLYLVGFNDLVSVLFLGIYLFCATMRLAYFNTRLSNGEGSNVYLGFPVTSSGIFIPIIILAYLLTDSIFVGRGLLLIISLLFILNIKIVKPKGKWFLFLMTGMGLGIFALCFMLI